MHGEFGAYGKGGIRNPQSGIRNPEPESETETEPEPKPELKLRPNQTQPVPDTRVGIKFKMGSSVIIVVRNFQHSDRDTKGILTFGKWLAKRKVSASYCYS